MPTPQTSNERLWRWALLIASTLVAVVALAGGLGRLLYVTRSEYTDEVKLEAVSRESIRGTLERLDKTLTIQAAAFDQLSKELQNVKLDLALAKKH